MIATTDPATVADLEAQRRAGLAQLEQMGVPVGAAGGPNAASPVQAALQRLSQALQGLQALVASISGGGHGGPSLQDQMADGLAQLEALGVESGLRSPNFGIPARLRAGAARDFEPVVIPGGRTHDPLGERLFTYRDRLDGMLHAVTESTARFNGLRM